MRSICNNWTVLYQFHLPPVLSRAFLCLMHIDQSLVPYWEGFGAELTESCPNTIRVQCSAALKTALSLPVQQDCRSEGKQLHGVHPVPGTEGPACNGKGGRRSSLALAEAQGRHTPCAKGGGNPRAALWGFFGPILQCDCCGCF